VLISHRSRLVEGAAELVAQIAGDVGLDFTTVAAAREARNVRKR
jgi:hypothetical protein